MLKVFETFAGIGAQHKAISNIGKNKFKVVGISEWDIFANISYAAIHHSEEFNKELKKEKDYKEEIEKLNKYTWSRNGKEPCSKKYIELMDKETLNKFVSAVKVNNSIGSVVEIGAKDIIERIGDVDLLTYSFPCQDLSVAGSFHGFNQGMKKGDNTRSGLLWEIERIVKELNDKNKKPKYLLLENVVNMVSSRHINEYHQWLAELKKLNYSTKTFKLDSSKYGLPQTRKRIYALSILDYKGKVDEMGEILDIDNPEELEMLPVQEYLREDYKVLKFKEEAKESQPNRTPSRFKMFDLNPKLNNKERLTARTITTKQDRHPNAGVIDLRGTSIGDGNRPKNENGYAKANYRFLTPRECYLLMGFEDGDFDRVKEQNIRKEKLLQQAGNSIAVKTIEQLFKIIIKLEG